MKLLRNSLPVVCLALLLLFFTGWNWLDWSTTGLLPWSVSVLVLFVCSVSWALSPSPVLRRINAALTAIAVLLGIALIAGMAEFRSLWALFVLTGFAGAVLYLYELTKTSSLYNGVFRYVLLVPVLLIVYAMIALFGWNGALFPAWIGLLLLMVLALIGLFSPQKAQKND